MVGKAAGAQKYAAGKIEEFCKERGISLEHVKKVRDILAAEHCRKGDNCFKKETAMNADSYEGSLKKGKSGQSQDKTVDFVIALAKSMLMVEAKLGVEDAKNISLKEIEGKIQHTKDLLRPCILHPDTIILISPQQFQERRRRLLNKLQNKPHLIPSHPAQLHADFF